MIYNDPIDAVLESLKYEPATEIATVVLDEILLGRKEFFNQFYERVVKNLRTHESVLFRAISKYRDKNVDVLSSPYMLKYCIFSADDAKPLYQATGVPEEEVALAIKDLKMWIKDGAKARGVSSMVDWKNITPFRILLMLVMRYYLERGEKEKLDEVCAYYAYSMYYTMFDGQFPNGVREATMIYTMNNISKKFILMKVDSVDEMLRYGVSLSVITYKQKLMECTDNGLMYIINQLKTRLKGYIKNISRVYYENDKKKNAIFESKETATNEEGTDIIDRQSSSGDIERNAQKYAGRFFSKPIDDEIVSWAAKMNQVSKTELKNVLTVLRADNQRITEIKDFYDAIFYLYMNSDTTATLNIHSKSFLSATDAIYKKGNSKEKNIVRVKQLIDAWLESTSAMYRETNRAATLNSLRKAIFQYFIFIVVMRK